MLTESKLFWDEYTKEGKTQVDIEYRKNSTLLISVITLTPSIKMKGGNLWRLQITHISSHKIYFLTLYIT